jgi:hypothetical protein
MMTLLRGPGLSFDFHRAHDELIGQLSQFFLRFSFRNQVCMATPSATYFASSLPAPSFDMPPMYEVAMVRK